MMLTPSRGTGDLLEVTPVKHRGGSKIRQMNTSENNTNLRTIKEVRKEGRAFRMIPIVQYSSEKVSAIPVESSIINIALRGAHFGQKQPVPTILLVYSW